MLEVRALGTVVEMRVEAAILVGSDGSLSPSRVEHDVDHRDIVVAEVGGYGALWLQVKGTTHPDREGRIVAFANYPVDAIPESARLLYLVALLDVKQHLLARLWLVPSSDFNEQAYRENSARQDRVTLQFSCLASGDARWDRFEVPRLELGARLVPMVAALGPATIGELSAPREQRHRRKHDRAKPPGTGTRHHPGLGNRVSRSRTHGLRHDGVRKPSRWRTLAGRTSRESRDVAPRAVDLESCRR